MSAGELGAVDPCRLAVTHKRILDDVMPGVATARPQRDEHAASPCSSNPNPNPNSNPNPTPNPTPTPTPTPNQANPFSCDLSDTELCSNIIERFLIRTLQGAGEGPAVQATAYALMMLLQDVCHCDEGTPALLPTWWAHRKVLQSGQGDDRAWKATLTLTLTLNLSLTRTLTLSLALALALTLTKGTSRKLVILSDTRELKLSSSAATHAAGADLLIHEATNAWTEEDRRKGLSERDVHLSTKQHGHSTPQVRVRVS